MSLERLPFSPPHDVVHQQAWGTMLVECAALLERAETLLARLSEIAAINATRR